MKKNHILRSALCAAALIAAAMLFASIIPQPAAAAAKPQISCQSLLLAKGQTYKLKLSNAKNVTWKSSKPKIASVNKSGKVTAKKTGTAVITASFKKKQYKCSVTVSSGKKDTLVLCFSATGTTASAAKKVKSAADADMIRLLPKKAYTEQDLDYGNDNSRATKEQRTPSSRPAIATVIKNLAQYKTVYLGYPIWWGKEPRVIRTFLDKNSMKGKTVIPFCTSGSSGISGSMAGIREGAKGAQVLDGKDLTDLGKKKVAAWVAEKKNEMNTGNKLRLKINDREMTVTWQQNASVEELKALVKDGPLTIKMTEYGQFEQFGPVGKQLPASDTGITTEPGDIVLYTGNQIVIFYGSNTWDYTKLGKIEGLTAEELKDLLGNNDVSITLYN